MTPYASAKSRYLRLELHELGFPVYGRGKPSTSRARRWYRNQLDRLLRREAREEIAEAVVEHRFELDGARTRRKVAALTALGYDPGEDDGDMLDVASTAESSPNEDASYDWDDRDDWSEWDTEYAPEPVDLDDFGMAAGAP